MLYQRRKIGGLSLAMACCATLWLCEDTQAADPARQPEVEVWRKEVGRDLVVLTRRPIAYKPLTAEQKRDVEKRAGGRGFRENIPVASYQYSARLLRADEKEPQLVWTKHINEYEEDKDLPFTMRDVKVGKSSVALLFSAGVFVQGDVLRRGEPLNNRSVILDNVVTRDSSSTDKHITAATLEGSPDDNTLRAKITRVNGHAETYERVKDGERTIWKMIADEEAKPAPKPDDPPAK